MGSVDSWEERLEETALAPTRMSGRGYTLWLVGLSIVIAQGFVAYYVQWTDGLYATAMRDRISWGLYIAAFVFFAGISMAGTLISAMLRAAKATWSAPITRIAESITVVGLISGALFIIVDMGRPERLYEFYLNASWQSPLTWDMISITIYLTASVVYLSVPMVPDVALFRDKLVGRVPKLQTYMYDKLALGWTGNKHQRRALHNSVRLLMLLIIPVAVSVHTALSWIFSTTSRVSWDSTIFGFFFVSGAVFSGLATLIIILAVMRRVYGLEEYITIQHFTYLAYLLAIAALVMVYGNASEYVTKGYKMAEEERFAFEDMFAGDFAPYFWFYFIGGLVIPILIVAFKPTRNLPGFLVAAVLANIAMFIERYFIVVAGMRVPIGHYEAATYTPSWVEWSIFASGLAGFMMLLTIFARFFPILAVHEIKEERAEVAKRAEEYALEQAREAEVMR